MDEIIIEEKRYISSKQAAKLTGYAKDYVGQLCREGRVPARLVGRSWYVLEAAIQDHRFGVPAVEPESKKIEEERPFSSNLEEPKYSRVPEDTIPSVNKLAYAPKAEVKEEQDPVLPLEDSWRAWFERAEAPVAAVEAAEAHEEPVVLTRIEEPVEEVQEEESVEVSVPVHAIHHSLYKPGEEYELPVLRKAPIAREVIEEAMPAYARPQKNYLVSSIQIGSIIVALFAAVFAVFGTGYLDSYAVSNRQVSFVAGVSFYNK